jgi:uncharacterized membrane protein YkoI
LALGGTVVAYAATSKTDTTSNNTGQAVTKEQSKEADEQDLNAADIKTGITEDQAKQAAMASVKNGTFQSIELEDEDGVIVYGIEIQSENQTYDVKVDANTGSILKTDQDNDAAEKDQVENEGQESGGDSDSIEHENENEDPDGYED